MAQRCDAYAARIVATVSQPIVVLTGQHEVEMVNDAFCRAFDVTLEETKGRHLDELGNGQWNITELRGLLNQVLAGESDVHDYRVEHVFERIGERVMLLNARRMPLDDDADRVVLAIDDITEIERQRHEIEGRKEFAEKLVDSIREGVLVLDWDLRVRSANQSFYDQFQVTRDETEGQMVYDLGDGQWDIPELRELLERVLPESEAFNDYEVEHRFAGIGSRIMQLNGRRLDHLNQIILAIRDVTELRDHERRQQAFMRELQHRVKNSLSNVRALARQTRRRSSNLDQFFDAFLPRLAALARAQELLLKSPQDEVDLGEIVRAELEAVGAERGRTYTAEGPPLWLNPRDTQAIAMAVHELATNAGKYGALNTDGASIRIEWQIVRDGEKELRFIWREHGVKIGKTACTRGLGSEVIEKSVPYMLGGNAALELHADGAECRIRFPLPEEEQ